MTHQQTTLRHMWLAGLGVVSRMRRTMDRIAGRPTVEATVVEEEAFVTTHKPAKRVVRAASPSSGSRLAAEHESRRRIAGKGR